MSLVTLITDFGTRDWFVGAMKGVLLTGCPNISIVDITHDIPLGDIRAGAFALQNAHRYFTPGSVHVTVVDPGVGSSRLPLAVKTAFATYVGPDNGILSWALKDEPTMEIRKLDNTALFRTPTSHTFHGRDIFAPVAALLAGGGDFRTVGSRLADFNRLPWPAPETHKEVVAGEIVYIDRFGNAISTLTTESLGILPSGEFAVDIGQLEPIQIAKCYSEAALDEPLAIIGSSGFLEISVNGGSAATALSLKVGSPIRVVSIATQPDHPSQVCDS